MRPIVPWFLASVLLLTSAAPCLGGDDLIFADGFESGDVSAWSSASSSPAPIARDDQAITTVDTPSDIFVTQNDTGNGSLLNVDDIVIETAPQHGTAVPGIAVVTYTPDFGFQGIDTFVYSVSNALSLRDVATVTVTVVPPVNLPPVAKPDESRTSPATPLVIDVLANDFDTDGSLDAASVTVVTQPANGTAIPAADGTVTYTPNAGFDGVDLFEYTVADNQGAESDPATVTVTVADLLGADMPPVDNISTAELEFLVRFGGRFVSRGVGLFLGFNHGTEETVANAEQIGDYTFLFPGNASDRAVSEPYTFATDLQTGSVTFEEAIGRYLVSGFTAAPIYSEFGGMFSVSSDTDPTLSFTIAAPDTPILDGEDQPAIVRGDFAQLATVVQYPGDEFTHFLVRFFTGIPGVTGTRIYLSRIPKEAMALDEGTGMRYAPIAGEPVRNRLDELGEKPVGDVAIVFYNQLDNTEIFAGPDRRPVPIAAGRGISLPGDQLVSRPTDRCEHVPANVLCEGGPNRRLLVTNRNGDVTIHDPEDGELLGKLLGVGAPNFVVDQGRQTIQDPATNCLLVSDTRAVLPNGLRGGAIHRYDTDGTLIQDSFINTDGTIIGLARPRGMAIFEGELHVATENDGRVLRFDPSTGAYLGARVDDPAIAPRDVEHLSAGDVLLSDSAASGTDDAVLLVAQDATSPGRVIVPGLANPSQISLTNDLNFVVADFSTGQVRFFNDGAENLLSLGLGVDSTDAIRRPVGVYPLDNGTFLVTGDRGTGVSILDPTAPDPTNALVGEPLVNGSSFEYIGEVCLPD